jgi:hypothetical protein
MSFYLIARSYVFTYAYTIKLSWYEQKWTKFLIEMHRSCYRKRETYSVSQKYGYTFKINSVCYCILKSEMVDGI